MERSSQGDTRSVRGVPHYELVRTRKAGLTRSGGGGCGKRQDKLVLRL